MFAHPGSIFKPARLNPQGLPLFLAWSIIAVVTTGSIALLHSDFLPQLLAGTQLSSIGTMLEASKGALIAVIILTQLVFQTRLVFPTIARRILWSILICLVTTISWRLFVENHLVLPGIIALLLTPICLTLVFFRVRRRPWLGILIAALVPLTFWFWEAAVMPWLEDWADTLLDIASLWLNGPDVLYAGALVLHNILTAAILAWLMPPCASVRMNERPGIRK